MRSDRTSYRFFLCVTAALILCFSTSRAARITDVQRGVYPGYELLVVYCDSLGDARLYYDRVLGVCHIQLTSAQFTPRAIGQAQSLVASPFLDRFEADAEHSTIILKLRRAAYIRTYVVTGPSALMIDLSPAPDGVSQLPDELDARGYLAEADSYEKSERYDLALPYIEHVQSINPGEPDYIHRAGILQHRIAHYNDALASFAKLCEYPRFAADARARRAMIYLTVGDTASSGKEWASYFHREPIHPPVSQASLDRSNNNGEAVAASTPAMPLNSTPVETSFFQKIRKGLNGAEGGFQVLAWLMLLTSAVILTRHIVLNRVNQQTAVANARRHSYSVFNGRPANDPLPEPRRSSQVRDHLTPDKNRTPFYRYSPSGWDQQPRENRGAPRAAAPSVKPVDVPRYRGDFKFPDPPRESSTDDNLNSLYDNLRFAAVDSDSQPEVRQQPHEAAVTDRASRSSASSKVADAYRRESEVRPHRTEASEEAGSEAPQPDKDAKIPVNKVLEMAAKGGNEMQIARTLGLGRDEVAMVLNLARLAHKGE